MGRIDRLRRELPVPVAPADRAFWSPDAATRFASLVAHELRTPLTTQRALLELALSHPATDASEWREIGRDVLDACAQQERLVETCLTLARSERLQRCEPVDLAKIAAEALRVHDPNEHEKVVQLRPALTTGDPALLERLAANLISNAVKHNIVGGSIEVATRVESLRAVLVVANTGPLIPPHAIDLIFQPFERLNHGDGLGLGLTIVDAVANAHRACIDARARVGGGLAVHVSFPAYEPLDRPVFRNRSGSDGDTSPYERTRTTGGACRGRDFGPPGGRGGASA